MLSKNCVRVLMLSSAISCSAFSMELCVEPKGESIVVNQVNSLDKAQRFCYANNPKIQKDMEAIDLSIPDCLSKGHDAWLKNLEKKGSKLWELGKCLKNGVITEQVASDLTADLIEGMLASLVGEGFYNSLQAENAEFDLEMLSKVITKIETTLINLINRQFKMDRTIHGTDDVTGANVTIYSTKSLFRCMLEKTGLNDFLIGKLGGVFLDNQLYEDFIVRKETYYVIQFLSNYLKDTGHTLKGTVAGKISNLLLPALQNKAEVSPTEINQKAALISITEGEMNANKIDANSVLWDYLEPHIYHYMRESLSSLMTQTSHALLNKFTIETNKSVGSMKNAYNTVFTPIVATGAMFYPESYLGKAAFGLTAGGASHLLVSNYLSGTMVSIVNHLNKSAQDKLNAYISYHMDRLMPRSEREHFLYYTNKQPSDLEKNIYLNQYDPETIKRLSDDTSFFKVVKSLAPDAIHTIGDALSYIKKVLVGSEESAAHVSQDEIMEKHEKAMRVYQWLKKTGNLQSDKEKKLLENVDVYITHGMHKQYVDDLGEKMIDNGLGYAKALGAIHDEAVPHEFVDKLLIELEELYSLAGGSSGQDSSLTWNNISSYVSDLYKGYRDPEQSEKEKNDRSEKAKRDAKLKNLFAEVGGRILELSLDDQQTIIDLIGSDRAAEISDNFTKALEINNPENKRQFIDECLVDLLVDENKRAFVKTAKNFSITHGMKTGAISLLHKHENELLENVQKISLEKFKASEIQILEGSFGVLRDQMLLNQYVLTFNNSYRPLIDSLLKHSVKKNKDINEDNVVDVVITLLNDTVRFKEFILPIYNSESLVDNVYSCVQAGILDSYANTLNESKLNICDVSGQQKKPEKSGFFLNFRSYKEPAKQTLKSEMGKVTYPPKVLGKFENVSLSMPALDKLKITEMQSSCADDVLIAHFVTDYLQKMNREGKKVDLMGLSSVDICQVWTMIHEYKLSLLEPDDKNYFTIYLEEVLATKEPKFEIGFDNAPKLCYGYSGMVNKLKGENEKILIELKKDHGTDSHNII